MSTNLIKWNDTDNRLTAYCDDDTGKTEIGPVKWDDTNNKLELNCDSTDFQAKWNDTDNELEAQSVGDGCCGSCLDASTLLITEDVELSFSGITTCGDGCGCAALLNGNSFILTFDLDVLLHREWLYEDASIKILLRHSKAGDTSQFFVTCVTDGSGCFGSLLWTNEECSGVNIFVVGDCPTVSGYGGSWALEAIT